MEQLAWPIHTRIWASSKFYADMPYSKVSNPVCMSNTRIEVFIFDGIWNHAALFFMQRKGWNHATLLLIKLIDINVFSHVLSLHSSIYNLNKEKWLFNSIDKFILQFPLSTDYFGKRWVWTIWFISNITTKLKKKCLYTYSRCLV